MTPGATYPRFPWLLGALATLLYLATLQRQLFGDGVFFARQMDENDLVMNHLLFLPTARALQVAVSLLTPIDAETAMKFTAALAGGAGVGLAYGVAREILASHGRAVVTAGLVATLHGYWFHATASELHSLHAACTTFLLLQLLRVINTRTLSMRRSVWLTIAVAITPGSHASGVCCLLPLAFAWTRAGPARGRLAISAAAGFVAFGVAYYWHSTTSSAGAAYNEVLRGIFGRILDDPGRIPRLFGVWIQEFGLHALPAATLMPAGLRSIHRTSPALALFLGSWMLAWSLISIPVDMHAAGSYYTPTFVVQSVLAVIAMGALGPSIARAVTATFLAAVPMACAVLVGGTVAAASLLACACLLWFLARDTTARPAALWLLPACGLCLSLPFVVGRTLVDTGRDPIRAAASYVEAEEERSGAPSLTVFIRPHTEAAYLWESSFPKAQERSINPLVVALYRDEARAAKTVSSHRSRIESVMAAGGGVWLWGSVAEVRELDSGSFVLDAFLDYLETGFTREHPSGAPDGLTRLVRKSPR